MIRKIIVMVEVKKDGKVGDVYEIQQLLKQGLSKTKILRTTI